MADSITKEAWQMTPAEIGAKYEAEQAKKPRGSFDIGVDIRVRAKIVKDAHKLSDGQWHKRAEFDRYALNYLRDSGFASIAWDNDGYAYYSKCGTPPPEGMFSQTYESRKLRDLAIDKLAFTEEQIRDIDYLSIIIERLSAPKGGIVYPESMSCAIQYVYEGMVSPHHTELLQALNDYPDLANKYAKPIFFIRDESNPSNIK